MTAFERFSVFWVTVIGISTVFPLTVPTRVVVPGATATMFVPEIAATEGSLISQTGVCAVEVGIMILGQQSSTRSSSVTVGSAADSPVFS